MIKTFKTPEQVQWYGVGDWFSLLKNWFGTDVEALCCPPPEFLKRHGEFLILLANGVIANYSHLDSKKSIWEHPWEAHVVGWLPFFRACMEDNLALQRFLINTTPASGEALEVVDVKIRDKTVIIAARSGFGITTFLQEGRSDRPEFNETGGTWVTFS